MVYIAVGGGGSLPVFRGARMQRGYGLGSMLKGLLRTAIPIVKSGGKFLGKKALQAGMDVVRDVANGKSLSSATTSNLKKIGREMTTRALRGTRKKGVKRKRAKKDTVSVPRAKRRRTSDIFDP